MNYESLFNRAVALAIDNTIWLVGVSAAFSYLPTSLQNDEIFALVYFLAFASIWFNYFLVCEWRWGMTLGKQVMGMKVVTVGGEEPGFGPASIRNVMRIVDIFFIGPIMIARSKRKQRLGDRFAGTVVVRTRSAPSPPPVPVPPAPQQAPQESRPEQPVPVPVPGTRSYATVWHRISSFLIDFFLFQLFFMLALGVVVGDNDDSAAAGWVVLVGVIAWFNYFAICEWRWGQTLGKRAVGIKVAPVESGRITFASALWRALLQLVDVWLVGPVLIGNSERRQRLGDQATGTVVVPTAPQPVPPVAPVEPPPKPGPGGSGGRALPWVTWGPREALLGLLAGLGLGAIVAPLLVLPFDPDLEDLGAILAAQALLSVALIGTAIYVARKDGDVDVRAALSRLGLRRFKPSALGLALLVLFVYFIAVAIYASLIVEPDQQDVANDLGLDRGLWQTIVAVALIAGVAPIAEESFFRGLVFAGLRARWPLWPAAIVSGLVFGAIHAPEGPTVVVPLALLGTGLAWLYDRTGSLWPCIFLHAVNNGLALAVAT